MSSNDGVFLYVGIVAIWAGFLVPAWVRRPHGADADAEAEAEADTDAEALDDGDGDEFAAQGVPVEAEARSHESNSRPAPSREYGEHVPDYSQTAPWPDEDRSAGYQPAGEPSRATDPPVAAGVGRAPGADHSHAGLSQSRQQMLRARRRMLAILVTLSAITGGFVLLGLVQWWICVPPIGMLVLYALLLREIAMADAEMASRRAALAARAARDAQTARHERLARQRVQAEWEVAVAAAEPGAEIIDISGRVGDQLYDQYADAAIRAVGD